jgi:hypothetical protein
MRNDFDSNVTDAPLSDITTPLQPDPSFLGEDSTGDVLSDGNDGGAAIMEEIAEIMGDDATGDDFPDDEDC